MCVCLCVCVCARVQYVCQKRPGIYKTFLQRTVYKAHNRRELKYFVILLLFMPQNRTYPSYVTETTTNTARDDVKQIWFPESIEIIVCFQGL